MQTDKKNALAWDSPDYIIRPKALLLQKDGNKFFYSCDKDYFPLPLTHQSKSIVVSYKYGMSRDTPFHTQYTEHNMLTPSIFGDEILFKSKNAHSMWHTQQESPKSNPMRKFKLFSRMLDRSASREELIRSSVVSDNKYRELLTSSKAKQFDDLNHNMRPVKSCKTLHKAIDTTKP